MSFFDVLVTLVASTLTISAPLIFTAMGGIFSERSGVVNIALEGIMIIGAFVSIVSTLFLQDSLGAAAPWVAILIAGAVCTLFSLLHAVASIHLRANQVVSGVALNILASGLGVFLTRMLFDGRGTTDSVAVFIRRINVPGLSEIPVIGPLFFSQVAITSYIAIAFVAIVTYVLFKTPFGLRIRSVGEHSAAADTMGINVFRMRYVGVALSGLLGGFGGAIFGVTIALQFTPITIAGQGFMALAAMIFGKWRPVGTLGACLFFGFLLSLSVSGSILPVFEQIPQVVLQIMPYILTILALLGFVGRAEAPKSLGTPYIKGKK